MTIDKGGLPRQSHHLGAGALILSPANRLNVEVEWRGESTNPISYMHVYLDNSLLVEMAAINAGLDMAQLEFQAVANFDDPLLRQLAYTLAQDLQQPESQSELYAETVARMLAMQLIRRHGQVRALEAKASSGSLSARSLRLLGDFVREHLQAPIALRDLAAVAGMNPYQFCRVFHRTTGQSPNQYVITQRMARASHLLRRTRLTIAHIASLVGYQSTSQFSALFKRHTGQSPGAFARHSAGESKL